MTKRILVYGAAVMTTLLALAVMWQFRTALVYVLISLALAAALRPLAARISGRSILGRVAGIGIYLLAGSGIGALLFYAISYAIADVQHLAQSVSELDAWTLPEWLVSSSVGQLLVTTLPRPSLLSDAITGSEGQLVLPAILGLVQGIGGLVSGALVISILSVYWSMSQAHFERLWLSLLPSSQRRQAREIWQLVEPELGAYVRSRFIQGLVVGALLFPGYWLLGSPYSALLALAGAVTCLIPVVGSALAITTALVVGVLTSAQISLFTVLYALLVVTVVGVWIAPRLFGQRWNNPVLTTVLLVILANVFGIVGIFVAPPLSVVCQILWWRLVSHRRSTEPATQLSDLLDRQERVQTSLQALEGVTPHTVLSGMQRLSDLIERAGPILEEVVPQEPAGGLATAPMAEVKADPGRN